MNKKEISNMLNEIFSTNIKWEKLNKQELEEIASVINDSKKMIKIVLNTIDIDELETEFIKMLLDRLKDRISIFELLSYAKKAIEQKF